MTENGNFSIVLRGVVVLPMRNILIIPLFLIAVKNENCIEFFLLRFLLKTLIVGIR